MNDRDLSLLLEARQLARDASEALTAWLGLYGSHVDQSRPAGSTGRELYVIRCMLLRATEQGSPRPGLTVEELTAGALEYAGTVTPPVTPAEVDAVLRTVFRGDPRVGAGSGQGDPRVDAGSGQGDPRVDAGSGQVVGGQGDAGGPRLYQGTGGAPEAGQP